MTRIDSCCYVWSLLSLIAIQRQLNRLETPVWGYRLPRTRWCTFFNLISNPMSDDPIRCIKRNIKVFYNSVLTEYSFCPKILSLKKNKLDYSTDSHELVIVMLNKTINSEKKQEVDTVGHCHLMGVVSIYFWHVSVVLVIRY